MSNFLKTSKESDRDSIVYSYFKMEVGELIQYYGDELEYCLKDISFDNKLITEINNLCNKGIFPNILLPGDFLLSRKDKSRFIKLEDDNNKDYFLKLRRVRTSPDFFSQIGSDIEITSLICLFSAKSIRAVLDYDVRVPFNQLKQIKDTYIINHFESDDYLSHYEIESLYRHCGFINFITKQSELYKKVRLQLPVMQYYIFGLEEYFKGSISEEGLLGLYKLIDERANRIYKLYKDRIGIEVILDIEMSNIKDYVINCIKSSKKPILSEALSILSDDRLWQYIIHSGKPDTRGVLGNNLLEAVGEIRPSFESNGKVSVNIKNPKEESTMTTTKRLSQSIVRNFGDHVNILGIYPHEKILLDHDSDMTKKRFYDVSEKPTYSNVKKIREHYYF